MIKILDVVRSEFSFQAANHEMAGSHVFRFFENLVEKINGCMNRYLQQVATTLNGLF